MSAIPFTLSIIFPGFTFGNWIIIFSFLQIVVRIALLRKNCVVSELDSLFDFRVLYFGIRCLSGTGWRCWNAFK